MMRIFKIAALSLLAASVSYAAEVRMTELATVSGEQGTWRETSFTSGGRQMTAILMTGPGPKFYMPPRDGKSGGDEWDRSTYTAGDIDGRREIYETHPLTGSALIITGDDGTLTIECLAPDVSVGELRRAAKEIEPLLRRK